MLCVRNFKDKPNRIMAYTKTIKVFASLLALLAGIFLGQMNSSFANEDSYECDTVCNGSYCIVSESPMPTACQTYSGREGECYGTGHC